MNAESSKGKSHFGNLTTFYSLLYTSAAIFFIGLLLVLTDTPEFGLIFIFIASILILISFVLFYIILYRVWKFIIAKEYELGITPSIPSAGQAVGYLFIPLFNIYWLFKGIGKLPLDINLVASKYKVQKAVQDNLGYIIAIFALIGFIPIVGYITGAINFLILLPIFIARCVEVCELIIASEVTPDKTTEIIKSEKINWQAIKGFPFLFNKEENGINYFIGIALFISLLLVRFMRLALYEDFDTYLLPEFDYFLIGIAFDVIVSVLFIVTCHLITKNWMQPFVWGAVIVAVFYFKSIIIMNAHFYPGENIIKIPYPDIIEFVKDFIWGFAFMLGFVFAINVWGAKIWSLITAFILSYIVYKALSIALLFGPFLTEINFKQVITGMDIINLFGSIFTALLFFGALFIHFDNLGSKKALQETLLE